MIAAITDIVVVPDDVDIVQLAMVGINPMTAVLMLRNYGDPSMSDRWIGQTAGNSAVGEYLIKLAPVRLENSERGAPRGCRRAGPSLGRGSCCHRR